jgi:hypothetical protein
MIFLGGAIVAVILFMVTLAGVSIYVALEPKPAKAARTSPARAAAQRAPRPNPRTPAGSATR